MTEMDRFRSLFTQQVEHTWDYVAGLTSEQWVTVPVDSDANFLGIRVNRITIAALLRHLCLTETLWFDTLPTLGDGGVMPPPTGTGPLDHVPPGRELVDLYRERHLASVDGLQRYSAETLDRTFSFVGRRYTVRGFLWAIYGHHCYHLGQVDQLMRQQNVSPPEFLEFNERVAVIA